MKPIDTAPIKKTDTKTVIAQISEMGRVSDLKKIGVDYANKLQSANAKRNDYIRILVITAFMMVYLAENNENAKGTLEEFIKDVPDRKNRSKYIPVLQRLFGGLVSKASITRYARCCEAADKKGWEPNVFYIKLKKFSFKEFKEKYGKKSSKKNIPPKSKKSSKSKKSQISLQKISSTNLLNKIEKSKVDMIILFRRKKSGVRPEMLTGKGADALIKKLKKI